MRVFTFGNGTAEGDAHLVDVLGGKGAGLARMSRLGVPVPPGFTIPAEACRAFYAAGEAFPEGLWDEVERGLAHIEALRGERFGDASAPLLVSVRSGAAVSMPGMMDTILDVGMDEAIRDGLAARFSRPRAALDSHRRFIEMFAEVALEVEPGVLAEIRQELLEVMGCADVGQLDEAALGGLISGYRARLRALARPLPTTPREQLRAAITGVFRSWNTPRAIRYRRRVGIDDALGTAVTVQSMVFGNLGADSATGVAFTRDPNTGEAGLFGEFLLDAQGEDVVSGAYTPASLAELAERMPSAYADLERIARLVEESLGDVQDLEFTIERGVVWMLQTRTARRSARAEVRAAVEMAQSALITPEDALLRVDPRRLTRLLHPSVDVADRRRVLARGLPASPGAVSGRIAFDPAAVFEQAERGEAVILVRVETSTDDMEAIRAATGVLTARGGMTSHAALVARGIGRCCVTGCAELVVDERRGRLRLRNGRTTLKAGDWITLDGNTGEVILGRVATTPADPPPSYRLLMEWADERRDLQVFASADNAFEAREAAAQGADGVGLCRTEHMFLGEDRLSLVREMVFAGGAARRRVVERMLPIQRADFEALLGAASGRSVGVRLLDLPLRDVVPDGDAEWRALAEALQTPEGILRQRAAQLAAENPIMGHRGCRLGLTFPEVYEIQIRALFEAALAAPDVPPIEVIIPLVTCAEEVRRLRRRIRTAVGLVAREAGRPAPEYTVGVMIETPRACLLAGEIAAVSDFFLFGSNDLTRTTWCISRDDAGRFLPFYLEHDVLPADPFVTLDIAGVGALIRMGVERGRAARPGLRCGLSGAQTTDPATVEFCHGAGLDYVSCPGHRAPVARLAAARAAVRAREEGAA